MDKKQIVKRLIKSRARTAQDLALFKRRLAKESGQALLKNSSLLQTYHEIRQSQSQKADLEIIRLLQTRPVRSLSGIVNVSVLTKAWPCPGQCSFCPTEKGLPKSYLRGEPAVERARRLKFDPYRQVQERLSSLQRQGHAIDKVDLRIIGGTWSAYPSSYQDWFVRKCFQAANDCGKKPSPVRSLGKNQKDNEKAACRIIGLSVETRPDFINEKELKRLRKLGATKVELGVQILDDGILQKNQRGHGLEAVVRATKLLRDAGFKISYQMMLNLPGATLLKDRRSFQRLFQDGRFRPDFLKIYPCAILKGTRVYQWYRAKKYHPYQLETLIGLIKEIKVQSPFYLRIERIIRDIPSNLVVEGPTKFSNLRQLINRALIQDKSVCRCIRCREVRNQSQREKTFLFREDYEASGGQEVFLSFEDKNRQRLYSLLRLRLPKTEEDGPLPFFPALKGAALVREVHTYGPALPFSLRQKKSPQHRGLGKQLMKEAEKIAQKNGFKRIAVIAGVGVRDYYRRLGYCLHDTYMVKSLD